MISSYGDQSTAGNNPSYYYRLHQRCLNCSECFQRHLMFYTCNYNIRVTHLNGAIKHIFYTKERSDPRRIISNWSLFILLLHALALHLAVKILLQIFLYEDLSTLTLHTSVGCISLQNASRTALFVTQPILLSENIPNIWHKSSTKHKEVRPDWNDKNDKCKLRPRITWRFYQWLRLPFLKKYLIKCEKI